jgi:FkbM family methyltransferase
MTIVSYSQNFEDVMLWRALGYVKNGFYIDVGAQDPVIDSVSFAFYEQGWRGVHVEPTRQYSGKLRVARPDEQVMQVAIGNAGSSITFYEIENTGLSTADPAIARKHRDAGFACMETTVPMIGLDEILVASAGRDIHWMKVDVEGLEKSVLETWTQSTVRPWVVLVESTKPLTQEESHGDWEHLLLQKGYEFVYFDGLNRFYLSPDHLELRKAFHAPPNVFDGFQLSGLASPPFCARLNQQIGNLEHGLNISKLQLQQTAHKLGLFQNKARGLEGDLSEARSSIRHLEQAYAQMENNYHAVINSRVWRMTYPVRLLGRAAKWFYRGAKAWITFAPGSRPRRTLRAVLVRARNLIVRYPRVANGLLGILSRIPVLEARVRAVGKPPVVQIVGNFTPLLSHDPHYNQWINENERIALAEAAKAESLKIRFSILLPVEKGQCPQVGSTLHSLALQRYGHWHVVVAPFATAAGESCADGLRAELGKNPRIEYCVESESRSAALRRAAEAATGDFVIVLEPGDILPEYALALMANRLGQDAEIDVLHGDEDILEHGYRRAPQLKPEWSPELLRSYNYFGRPVAVRRQLMIDAGNFSPDLGLAAEWDLYLRLTEPYMNKVATAAVRREPVVLCHRNPASGNGRVDRVGAGKAEFVECLRRHWERQGINASITVQSDGTLHANWAIENPPLVSVIIPNKNRANLLTVCLDGLWNHTDYPSLEIIVVDNGSTEEETLALYRQAESKGVKVVDFNQPFNYSRACNVGAAVAHGELLLFLNNDIEVTRPDWLSELARQATLPGVGVVGTKLVYPDGVLQHAGVVVGMHVCGLVFHRGDENDWGPFGSPSVTRNWMGIMGACQMIRRTAFDRIGGFDENYQIAMSDVKLCIDAWRAGYRTVYAPMAKLIHHEGASRGKTNPTLDMARTIRDIYARGVSDDPYFHPGLSAIPPVPTLRIGDEPNSVASLTIEAEKYDLFPTQLLNQPDIFSDQEVAVAAGCNADVVVWHPDPSCEIQDQLSAARFLFDLLRHRPDIRARYPEALSEGANGAFVFWLNSQGLKQYGYHQESMQLILDVFNEKLETRAKQATIFEYELREANPDLFLPTGRQKLVRCLFNAVGTGSVSKESVWWFLLLLDERPEEGVFWTWQHRKEWQQLFPYGLTRFGRQAFSEYLYTNFDLGNAGWLDVSSWRDVYTPEEQVLMAYRNRPEWQQKFPHALGDPVSCREFLCYLVTPRSNLETSVCDWLQSNISEALVSKLCRPGVNIFGHFSYPSGLRTSTQSIIEGLKSHDFEISLCNVPAFLSHEEADGSLLSGPELFDVSIIHVQPEPFFNQVRQRADLATPTPKPYQIGYWYWEFDTIPESWDSAAENCDEIWTATEFIAKGLRERYKKPVHVFFPGIELLAFPHQPRSYYQLPEGSFIFLFAFHMTSITERKNPIGLIRAFKKAFALDENVLLVIKTSFGSSHPAEMQRLVDEAAGANIRIIDEVYTNEETMNLMRIADAYVSLHRSEGLGLTMAEAMLLGKPTIGTRYSGNLDFMDDGNSLLVDFKPKVLERDYPPYSAGLVWADPSVDDAARHMRRLFDDQAYARELGRRGKEDLERRLCYPATGRRMAERLNEIRAARA